MTAVDLPLHPAVLVPFGILIGFFGTLVGVGGGFFMVPYFTLAGGFPPVRAVGTSLGAIVFNAVSGSIRWTFQRRIDWVVATAFALAAAVLGLPRIKDWSLGSASENTASCHTKLFGHNEANIDLAIAVDQWDALTTIYQDLAAELMLSLLDQSEVRPEVVHTLYLSACNEDVLIKTGEQRWAPDYQPPIAGRGVGIHVYSDASSEGQSATRRLIQRLQERWPEGVRFVDSSYSVIPMPANLEPE